MSVVRRDQNLCQVDKLDKKTLKDGELIEVLIEDKWQRIKVTTITFEEEEQDMFSKTTIPHSYAYGEIVYKGHKALLPLRGMQARRM